MITEKVDLYYNPYSGKLKGKIVTIRFLGIPIFKSVKTVHELKNKPVLPKE